MAMNPDAAGDQGQAPNPDAAGDAGGGDPMQMLVMLGEGLTTVVDGLTQDGAPKEVLAPFQAALDAFTQGYQMLQGSMGGPQQSGPAPMEAGGAQVAPAGDMRMRG